MARAAAESRSAGEAGHASYVNRFGRRPGRGLRPWLLLPKVIAVAGWIGGLAAATSIAWHVPVPTAAPGAAAGATSAELALVRNLLDEVLRPALVAAVVLGIALLLQHPRVFLKARWCRVKLALIVLTLPACGALVNHSLTRLQSSALSLPQWAQQISTLRWSLTGGLVASIAILIMGRLKPRLGQRYGKPDGKPGGKTR